MLKRGVPDEAYKPLTGDDKETARAYGRYNKQQRDGKGATGLLSELRPPESLSRADQRLHALPEDDLRQVEAKIRGFDELRASLDWQRLKSASDLYVAAYLYTAAYFARKSSTASSFDDLPITGHVWNAAGGRDVPQHLVDGARKTSDVVRAFHWHIEFPRIFNAPDPGRRGFDVIIGNPPWERIKLQEQEFFAARSPDIAGARNKAEREKLIKKLEKAEPDSPDGQLWADFQFAKRTAEASSEFVRTAGRYPLTGKGDVNTYALFAELFFQLTNARGFAGVIVPTGIATDLSTSAFFGELIERSRLVKLLSFYEIRRWFKGTDDRKAFCILMIGEAEGAADFCFDIENIEDIDDPRRSFKLTSSQIARINPNTRTAPVFRSRADADITAKLYVRAPVLIEQRSEESGGDANPWGITFQTLFHMSNDSHLFATAQALEAEGWIRDGADWIRRGDPPSERRIPLYEAKMTHLFDHRWATYAGGSVDDEEGARDCTPAEKQNPNFETTPRYWVPEEHVRVGLARVPASLKRGFREGNADRVLKSLTEWLVGYLAASGERLHESELARILGHHSWRSILGSSADRFAMEIKTIRNGGEMQRETPLTAEDIEFLSHGSRDPLALAAALLTRKQPRWLMGWRRNARTTDERTWIPSVLPKVGVGDSIFLWNTVVADPKAAAVLLANASSLTADFAARQKVGGTNLSFYFVQQFPVLPPSSFSSQDVDFVAQRVLELSYTSHAMRPWAEDLGYNGPAFGWHEDRRMDLRAELDAFYALKYGLSRDELRYVLDPGDVKGRDYPSETFRVLKANEERRFNEFRTQRLVLDAYDRLSNAHLVANPIELRTSRARLLVDALPDNAWARTAQSQPGDVGAVLAAILKTMDGPKPIRDVRLVAAFAIEPRLLAPLLSTAKAAEWQRLVGAEADPLAGNVATFVARNNTAWGAALRNHRGNGRLVEDIERGTWAPGPGLDILDTSGWPDGRAGFVFGALEDISLDAAVDSLPADIQQWVTNAAAA